MFLASNSLNFSDDRAINGCMVVINIKPISKTIIIAGVRNYHIDMPLTLKITNSEFFESI